MRAIILDGRDIEYSGEVHQAILPGRDGEFSVLDFHQPFLYRLRKGIIKIQETEKNEEEKIVAIRDGLARFRDNELLVMKEK
ncbi:MAG: F0F1 ATP synthase subunit epsilon [Candidatus Omnitrophota bacterium]